MSPRAHSWGHMASHVHSPRSGYVPATLLHSALTKRKLPRSFLQHVQSHNHQTCTPRGYVPAAGLPQCMAPYQRTKLHPPASSQVLPVGCQSQVVIWFTCVHITCRSDVYVAWLRSCQSPSEWHHTWYSQKRPAETPSKNSQLQTTHSPQSQHA